ncbi:MAG: glutamine-synthetase adenylyltransferase [Bryobacteraceae bacterium]
MSIAPTLDEIVRDLPAFLAERTAILVGHSADPPTVYAGLSALRQRQPEAFVRLIQSPAGLQFLIAVFSQSRFLSEEVLQHPEWIDELRASGDLHRVLSADEFRSRLRDFAGNHQPEPLQLATFRRKQILRILIRDVLGYAALSEVTEELSSLADAIVDVAYWSIYDGFETALGTPRDESGAKVGFSVIALGKMGGEELNYSSDIDLMFVYGANGSTDGADPQTNKEFFKRVANELTRVLSTYTPEGLCYRVDLRLRPEGKLGEVCISLEGAKRYYSSRARDWELQMMIKARTAAADASPGRELLEFVEPLTYSTTLDFQAIETMSVTRVRLNEKLAARKIAGPRAAKGAIDIKLARGGIRDIEFLVQCLQRLHGGRVAWVRHGGTMLALSRLQDKNLLSPSEYGKLAGAYQFFRHLEHRLQFDEDRQTHQLPSDPNALAILAARMPQATYADESVSAAALIERLRQHLDEVVTIYDRIVHAHQSGAPPTPEPSDERPAPKAVPVAHLPTRPPAQAFDVFRDRLGSHSEQWRNLERDPMPMQFARDLFAYSPYFSEQLVREPDLLIELRQLQEFSPGFISRAPDTVTLRRAFRREMFRLQARGICLGAPVFETLAQTSDLADRIIGEVYGLAVRETITAHPPESPAYQPLNQMMVIALGRLGLREFDVASDADLVFVLPDADAAELLFWTRAASRMVDILTAYTGEGTLFAVDTRLRPNGREGALVQTVTTFSDYFERKAEAWEGLAYMKARTVAGNLPAGEEFLHALQELDWRRYGQSGRSRADLRQMRMRLEREQGGENPLKAGFGGFYDIDFLLLYLRLKAAGFFFPVLNTPERIDIIEKMGHLDREDADFLREAATFYRALDHSLRVATGHVEGRLPNSEPQVALLAELVTRALPEGELAASLQEELARIQTRTREVFDRYFG